MTPDPESFEAPRRGRGRPPRDPAIRPGDPGVIGGRAAESFSHAILDSLPALVAVIESDGRIIAVNKAWERFAHEAKDVVPAAPGLGGNYLDALQDHAGFEAARADDALEGLRLVLDRQRARFELEYPLEMGKETRYFLLSVTPLLGVEGGAAISHVETTGRRRAEEEILHQHRMLEAVLESSAAGVIVADLTGEFRIFNRAARELAGVGLIDEDPERWSENFGVFHPDRVTLMRTDDLPLARAIAGEATDAVRMFVRNAAIPGGRFLEASGRPWTTPDGERRGGVVVFSDVTDRVLTEEQSRLQIQVLDMVPLAVLALDPEGRVVYWNVAAEQLFGWSAAELVGRRGRDVLLDDAQRAQVDAIRAYVESDRPFRGEFQVKKPDGTLVPVLASATALRKGDGSLEAFVLVGVDLTDVELTHRTLRPREDALHQVQKMEAIGRLAGGVAHDFNNLLTVMRGFNDILLERLPAGDPSRVELDQMARAIARAGELTERLLSFGRDQPVALELVDLNTVVSDFMPLLRRTLGEDIRVKVELDPASALVRAEATRVGQVLLNLANNAREAMPKGGELTVTTRHLDPGPGVPEATVRLSIADTGPGMDAETKVRAFEPFFTTKEPGQGSGLGLSTSYAIVRQMGGSITLDSEPGRGTIVLLDFPRVFAVADEPPPVPAPPTPEEVVPATLLVIEDDPGVRSIERRLLEQAGHLVLEAADGGGAEDLVRAYTGPIDLVVCDVVLPGRGGREVVEALRTLRPGLRALFVSGHPPDVAARLGALTDSPFLQKPFSAADLHAAVRQALSEGTPEAR